MRPNGVLSTSHLWPHTAWPSYTILIAKSDRCHILIIIVITTSDGNSLESDQKKSRLEKKFKHGKILDMKILVLYNYKNWKLSVSHIIHYCYYMNTKSHKYISNIRSHFTTGPELTGLLRVHPFYFTNHQRYQTLKKLFMIHKYLDKTITLDIFSISDSSNRSASPRCWICFWAKWGVI